VAEDLEEGSAVSVSVSVPKTAFVLGAGFSRDAGCPLQAEILDRIRAFDISQLTILDDAFDITRYFGHSRDCLFDFLGRVFPAGVTPSLEDVFTLLDQTIENRGVCAAYSWQELDEIRRHLNRAMLFVFHWETSATESPTREFYRAVACDLLKRRIRPGQASDPLSVISLNWDSLLEDDMYWCIEKTSATRRVDIDYCCYTTPLDKSGPHMPSPTQRAAGLFNVKIMKLHGSANWLSCPNCRRLFTGIGEERTSWELYVQLRTCPECGVEAAPGGDNGTDAGPTTLEPCFITPTFVKRFDNPHIQMTWHNAFLDLAEADEVVFIGYSLPDADYHVRTLLRRAVRLDALTKVVLAESDGPGGNNADGEMSATAQRYVDFFGEERVTFDFSGVRGYFEPVIGAQGLGARLGTFRQMLDRRTRKS